jgi:hypothetical protein
VTGGSVGSVGGTVVVVGSGTVVGAGSVLTGGSWATAPSAIHDRPIATIVASATQTVPAARRPRCPLGEVTP